MAVTKTHPVKSTVGKALDYILDEKKTDGKLLVSSYACSYETADLEFEITREKTPQTWGVQLARHLIQSFEPNETTPEQAHEIGKRLADELLQGKYEYVLSTHIDRGHIHNHIIFNTVSFADGKKFRSNKRTYYNIRGISDKLCAEYGLSVIVPGKEKGKSYAEYTAEKNGTSRKAQLKAVIDTNIKLAKDIDEFISLMEKSGYKVKRQNKNIPFCTDGFERYMRSKTLGPDYTLEALTARIAGQPCAIKSPKQDRRLNLIIDIQNSIKAQESKRHNRVPEKPKAFWEEEEQRSGAKIRKMADLREAEFVTTRAKIHNLKQASQTLNYLTEHNITTYDELEKYHREAHTEFESTSDHIKDIEQKINSTAIIIKNIEIYQKFKPVYEQFKKAKDKKEFEEKHRPEIVLFEKAYKELKTAGFPNIKELRKEYSDLTEIKSQLYDEYKQGRSKVKEIDTVMYRHYVIVSDFTCGS